MNLLAHHRRYLRQKEVISRDGGHSSDAVWPKRAEISAAATGGLLGWRRDLEQRGVELAAELHVKQSHAGLLPLLVERRYISLDLAVVPIARPDHNFLFQWKTMNHNKF